MENNIHSLQSISRNNDARKNYDNDGDEDDDARIISICRILGKPVAYSVLLSLMNGPKTGEDISIEKKLPRSSTYKAIRQLQKVGIVFVSSYKDPEKKKVVLYKSAVDDILIRINKNGSILTTGSGA